MREKIAALLAQNYKQATVASMVGCTPQYIAELMKDDSFKEQLRAALIEYTEVRLDNKYTELEENTIQELNQSIASADIGDLARVLESIARIRNSKKSPVIPGNLTNPTLGITLVFNAAQAPALVTDDKNRVIALGSSTMLPMPAKAVKDMFTKMDETHEPITIEALTTKAAAA